MPLADRDRYNTLSCPYGNSSDYNKMNSVVKKFNLELTTMIKNTTVTVLASILGYYVFVGLTGTVANGHYIKAIGVTVHKNNLIWYEKINYGGKSKVIPTYSVYKQY